MDEKKEVRKIKSVKLIKDLPGIKWGQTIDGDYAIYKFTSENLNLQSFSREIILDSPDFFKVEYEEKIEKRTVLTLKVEVPDAYIEQYTSFDEHVRRRLQSSIDHWSKVYEKELGDVSVSLISSKPVGRIRVKRYLDKRVLRFIKNEWKNRMKRWDPKFPGTVRIPSRICEHGFRNFLSDTTSTFEQQMTHVNYYRVKFEDETKHSIRLSIEEGAAYKNFLQKVIENMERVNYEQEESRTK